MPPWRFEVRRPGYPHPLGVFGTALRAEGYRDSLNERWPGSGYFVEVTP